MNTHFAEIPISTDCDASSTSCVVATLRMVPNTCTHQKGSKWIAACEWNGRIFEAEARNGAAFALCRKLVKAGCPDQPLEIRNAAGRPALFIRSIHVGAKVTVRESGRTSIRLAPYEAHPGDSVSASEQGGAISPRRVAEVRKREARTSARSLTTSARPGEIRPDGFD